VAEEKEVETEGLEEFAKTALAGKKMGAYEIHVCQHLAACVSADELKKIRLVCEAAFAAADENWLSEETLQELDGIYKVAEKLIKARRHVSADGMEIWSVNWGFTKEEFERLIKPWNPGVHYYPELIVNNKRQVFKFFCKACGYVFFDDVPAELPEEDLKQMFREVYGDAYPRCPACGLSSTLNMDTELYSAIDDKDTVGLFFEASTCLTPAGYSGLVSAFVTWAMPKVMKVSGLLAKHMDPGLYRELLELEREKAGKEQ